MGSRSCAGKEKRTEAMSETPMKLSLSVSLSLYLISVV